MSAEAEPTPPAAADVAPGVAVVRDLLAGRIESARARLVAGRPTGERFLAFATRQRLGWFVVDGPGADALRGLLPREPLDVLAAQVARRRSLRERNVGEIARVIPALAVRGIDATLLKGQHLAARFPLIAPRTFVDSDILVDGADADAACAALRDLGWTLLSRAILSSRISRRFAHGFDFARGDLRIDLHWSIASHVSYRIDAAALRRNRGRLDLPGGATVPVLADEDLLFELLLSLFEDVDRGGASLRSCLDIDGVLAELDDRVDWTEFWSRRAADRTLRPTASALALVLALLDPTARHARAARSLEPVLDGEQVDEETALDLLSGRCGLWRNKRWAMDRYECRRWRHAAWWLRSLPFRLSAYRAAASAGSLAHGGRP